MQRSEHQQQLGVHLAGGGVLWLELRLQVLHGQGGAVAVLRHPHRQPPVQDQGPQHVLQQNLTYDGEGRVRGTLRSTIQGFTLHSNRFETKSSKRLLIKMKRA